MLNLKPPQNPNYAATVVELKHFVPLAGCDNVQGTLIFGNQVIVGKDAQPGDVGLYFPIETALSHEFLAANDLYCKPEYGNRNPTKKGFFEKHGRVKCVKFRGHKSEGFFIPLTSLNMLAHHIQSPDEIEISDIVFASVTGRYGLLAPGAEFDEMAGHEICRKYVPARNPGRLSSNAAPRAKRADVILPGQFAYHIDTAKLDRNIHRLNPTDLISITEKWHGCLSYNTRILMPDFSWKTIGSLVNEGATGVEVLGFANGQIITTKILNVFNNGKSPVWLKIGGRRIGGGWGGSRFAVYATPNHKFWVNGEYVKAHTLMPGDRVTTFRNSPELTPLQKSVLLGKILGDGTICSFDNTHTAEIQYGHIMEKAEYVHWTKDALGFLSRNNLVEKTSGYGSPMLCATTSRIPAIYDWCQKFMKDGKKFITEEVILALDPISLAFWYMDDGNIMHAEGQDDRAAFATNGFSADECETLCIALQKFGITANTENYGAGNRIRLTTDGSEKLFLMIAPYMPPCMRYKLPERYREGVSWLPRDKEKSYRSWLVEQEIDSIEILNKPRGCDSSDRFDIETESHNFFANGVLVHNSSAIFAHVLAERSLKWYEKLLVRMGVNIARTEYAHVWASRRVIKGVGGQAREGVVHYYKSDIWGEVFKEVKDLIPKGYTLYGEIVGYTPDGAPVQGGYTYGCAPGQHKFVVYRITYTNPEGVVLNLSWPQIREFCNSRGLETVKEVYYGYANDAFIILNALYPEDDTYWQTRFLEMLKQYYVEDKPCPHNPGMPAEGIVLRIERAAEFEAYKCKSFAFLQLESKQLDKGAVDLETEESTDETITGIES